MRSEVFKIVQIQCCELNTEITYIIYISLSILKYRQDVLHTCTLKTHHTHTRRHTFSIYTNTGIILIKYYL